MAKKVEVSQVFGEERKVRFIITSTSKGANKVSVSLLNEEDGSCHVWTRFYLSQLLHLLERFEIDRSIACLEVSGNLNGCSSQPSKSNASRLSALIPKDLAEKIGLDE